MRCQLCHAHYIVQRRWLEETIPIPSAYWNNLLSQPFVIIAVVHYLHLLSITHFIESIPRDPQLTSNLLHAKPGIQFYYGLLGITTFIYTIYYANLLKKVVNRQLYLYFGAFDITCFLAAAALCLYLVQYTIFPCGGIYIYLLSNYRKAHVNILQEINLQGTY